MPVSGTTASRRKARTSWVRSFIRSCTDGRSGGSGGKASHLVDDSQLIRSGRGNDLDTTFRPQPPDQLSRDGAFPSTFPGLALAMGTEQGERLRSRGVMAEPVENPSKACPEKICGPGLGTLIGYERAGLGRDPEPAGPPGGHIGSQDLFRDLELTDS